MVSSAMKLGPCPKHAAMHGTCHQRQFQCLTKVCRMSPWIPRRPHCKMAEKPGDRLSRDEMHIMSSMYQYLWCAGLGFFHSQFLTASFRLQLAILHFQLDEVCGIIRALLSVPLLPSHSYQCLKQNNNYYFRYI